MFLNRNIYIIEISQHNIKKYPKSAKISHNLKKYHERKNCKEINSVPALLMALQQSFAMETTDRKTGYVLKGIRGQSRIKI